MFASERWQNGVASLVATDADAGTARGLHNGAAIVASSKGATVRFALSTRPPRWPPSSSERAFAAGGFDTLVAPAPTELDLSPNATYPLPRGSGWQAHLAQTGRRIWLAVGGASVDTLLVNARTCRAADVAPGCDAATAPLLATTCTPGGDVLASSCVRVPPRLAKATLTWSDDNGLSWATPVHVGQGGQSVALGLVATEDVRLLYATGADATLRVAIFDAQTATLRSDLGTGGRWSAGGAALGEHSVAYVSGGGTTVIRTPYGSGRR